MNLKKKLFGLGAASILALSITTGAMAQDQSAEGTADLIAQNSGQCTASFHEGSFDFGEWTWDGAEYVPGTVADAPKSVSGEVNTPDGSTLCDITVTFGGLSYEDSDGRHTIGLDYFNGGIAHQPGVVPNMNPIETGTFQFPDVSTDTLYLFLQLHDVPDDIPAGVYSGDLEITDVSAQ